MPYFDAASAAPLHPVARQALQASLDEGWADPARLYREGRRARLLLDGATYLFSNEYEKGLIESKTGWSDEEILAKVGHRVTTLGSRGVRVERVGEDPIEVGCAEEERKADPTGVGDAFRAGFLSGLAWGVSLERAAQVGCMLATLVIETVGTQEYQLRRAHFMDRFAKAYGDEAAAEVQKHLA